MHSALQPYVQMPLTNHDILYLSKNRVNIVTYKQLMDVDDIEQIMFKDKAVIYINQKGALGHWVCLDRFRGGYRYFDSYGLKPDEGIPFGAPYLRKLGITHPKLTELLYKSRKPIDYFPHRMQGADSATCGRWVLLRLRRRSLSDKIFYETYKDTNLSTADEKVTALCLISTP